MTDADEILRDANRVELVDWPHQSVPAALHRAGIEVVGHEPDSLKRYTVESTAPEGVDALPLEGGAWLLSRNIAVLPTPVDIVCTFRPPEEQVDLARDAIANGARAFWVEPGAGSSDEARALVVDAGLVFVDGESIADAVRRVR